MSSSGRKSDEDDSSYQDDDESNSSNIGRTETIDEPSTQSTLSPSASTIRAVDTGGHMNNIVEDRLLPKWKFINLSKGQEVYNKLTIMYLPISKKLSTKEDQKSNDQQDLFKYTNNDLYLSKVNKNVAKSFDNIPVIDRDLRFEFIVNMMMSWKELNLLPVKYNLYHQKFYLPYREEVHGDIRHRLINLIVNMNKTSGKKIKSTALNKKRKAPKASKENKKSSRKSSSSNPSPSKSPPYKLCPSSANFNHLIHNYSFYDLHEKGTYYKKDEVSEWSYHSIIHSLFSPFDLYLYPYSHRIKAEPNALVHISTKIKLHFPPSPNMFVIFHARMVHSGAESRVNNDSITSIQPPMDPRMFNYVKVKNKEQSFNDLKHSGKGNGLEANFKVDRNNINLCCSKNRGVCSHQVCQKMSSTHHTNIFLGEIYEELRMNSSNPSNLRNKPILGNLDTHGFEVWLGVNTRSYDFIDLKFDLKEFADKKSWWSGLDNNTHRKSVKVSRPAQIDSVKKKSPSFDFLVDNLESLVCKKVMKGRKDVQLSTTSILGNHGIVDEQLPHRDYPTKNIRRSARKT